MPSKTAQQLMPFFLKDCPTAHAILTLSGLDNRLLVWDYSCYIDWIKDIICVLDKKVIADFITWLWNYWNNRNNYVFRGKEEEAMEKPPYGFVKVNFDATVSSNKIGYGVVVWDSDGFVLGGGGGFKDKVMSAEWRELYTFEESLKIECSLNITKAIFETDCASLVNMVKKHGNDITIMGYHIDEAYKNMESFNSTTVN
ncbi:hypothetical protein Goari_006408 [Gossypium aridum]|uniref:RNase H type-1 domain-containing protein n=1 Tax=Gossypium aridum TaxID=34290 RepID=A0A7J8XMV4_GOSAI|nr:hypothetical protein [Gossypium aridum]